MNFTEEALRMEPISIARGIYWVGYVDENRGLHCNPYLIVEGDEAVIIDGGNRDDFSTVMLKILRTGLNPSRISRLIYQHYDPDLCGSLPQLEALINSSELRIISHAENNVFIHYYSAKTEKLDFRRLGSKFEFATGRRLEFHLTPYCHHPGSFVTYDTETKTLFSSDLFGSFDTRWTLMLEMDPDCAGCADPLGKSKHSKRCPMGGIIRFHQRIMTSSRALNNSLDTIERLDIERIAPQHGSIISSKEDAAAVIRQIKAIKRVGIDRVLAGEEE